VKLVNEVPDMMTLLKSELKNLLEEKDELNFVKYFEIMVPTSLLGQGKSFGELALEVDPKNPSKQMKRQASVLAT
jgi:hypothetical protein